MGNVRLGTMWVGPIHINDTVSCYFKGIIYAAQCVLSTRYHFRLKCACKQLQGLYPIHRLRLFTVIEVIINSTFPKIVGETYRLSAALPV